MFANHPEMAKRWADHTKDMKALPEKKENDKEKEASLSAELLDKAAALLSNRISGKPSVPLPSAINPNRPTLGIKPVQQNPLTGNSPQYGANSQQAVQQKAQQLGQPQQPQKMAFLRKLAETPPNYLRIYRKLLQKNRRLPQLQPRRLNLLQSPPFFEPELKRSRRSLSLFKTHLA